MSLSMTVQRLIEVGQGLFSKRGTLMSYLQELAEQFLPERADFTTGRNEGNFWLGLMSSEGVQKRRDLGDLIQQITRPDGENWFEIHVDDTDLDEHIEARKWLEWMTKVQRRAMYAPPAHFSRAMKQLDADWVTFGMSPLEIDVRKDMPSLLYTNHHLRDVAWSENGHHEIDTIYHRWRPTVRQLADVYRKEALHPRHRDLLEKTPQQSVRVFRIFLPRDHYNPDTVAKRTPKAKWMSLVIDEDNEHVIAETPYLWNKWVIPRWQTIPLSQYGWSPATGPGLNDTNTLQAVWRVLLEAGEKAVDPPMAAVEEALRSDIGLMSGGLTFLSADYDERSGAAVRPLINNPGQGLPAGFMMGEHFNRVLHEGFYLNRLELPDLGREMTMYETRKRVEQHLRQAMPLLTPSEDEVNAAICDRSYDILQVVGAFGPAENLPDVLMNQKFQYEFASPLRDMAEEVEAQKLFEVTEMTKAVMEVNPDAVHRVDWDRAHKEAIRSTGVPSTWLRSDEEYRMRLQQAQQMAALQQGAALAQQGAETADTIASAQQKLLPPPQQGAR